MSNIQNTNAKPGASQPDGHFRWDGADLLLRLKISPRASRDPVARLLGDRLKISNTAPAVAGQPNGHLMKFIAKQLGVAKARATVVSGETSCDKTVRITKPRTLPGAFQMVQTTDGANRLKNVDTNL